MQGLSWNDIITHLHEIDGLSTGTLLFIAVIFLTAVGAALIVLRLILQFSHEGVFMFLPFISESLKALATEKTKDHMAIKVERRLHYLFVLVLLFSSAAILLHSLVPLVGKDSEKVLAAICLTSLVVCVALGGVSVRLATHL
jgi:hypothetical protein